MEAYTIRRLLHSILVLAAVLVVVFLVGHALGDPVRLMLPPEVPEEVVSARRKELGLDVPLYLQFLRFAAGAVRADFGNSLWQRVPAMPLVLQRLPATFYLAGVTIVVVVPLAIGLGVISAARPGSVIDSLVTVISYLSISLSQFWVALMLVLVFAVQLSWFPTSGYGGVRYVVLPALTMILDRVGRIAQVTRTSFLEELGKGYITTARAKGLKERVVVTSHILKNAALPIVTLVGQEAASLVGGVVLVETIFAWPGLGLLIIQSIERRDLPLVEACVFVTAALTIAMNLLVDLSYAFLNPRIRLK